MLKKINMSYTFTCILALVLSGICYADTYSYTATGTMQCSPSFKEAGWEQIEGEPDKQYTITTIGIEAKGIGLIVDWNDYLEHDYNNELGICDTGYVIAKCEPSNEKATKMYSFRAKDGIPAPSLSCPKGKGVLLRFVSPNNPDPDKYVFKYKLTVVQGQANDQDPVEQANDQAPVEQANQDDDIRKLVGMLLDVNGFKEHIESLNKERSTLENEMKESQHKRKHKCCC